jgi:hypothetical protein
MTLAEERQLLECASALALLSERNEAAGALHLRPPSPKAAEHRRTPKPRGGRDALEVHDTLWKLSGKCGEE